MTDPRTPGQIAYEAYWQVRKTDGHKHYPPPFDWLPAITRQSWEAAAQAVLTPPISTMSPAQGMEELRRLVGQYWAGVDVDAYMDAVRGEEPPP